MKSVVQCAFVLCMPHLIMFTVTSEFTKKNDKNEKQKKRKEASKNEKNEKLVFG